MRPVLFLLITLLATIWACTNPPEYPNEPYIEFVSLSKNTMVQNANPNGDSLLLTLYFTDGDGNIGREDTVSVFLTDKRDGFVQPGFKIPTIGLQGVGKGISGELYISIPTTCCYFDDGRIACQSTTDGTTDDLVYEVYIIDRDDQVSNVIETPVIQLQCR